MSGSMFERCGGFTTVRKVVAAFYDKVLDSPSLSRHFANVDMRALIDHQTKFITYVMGGPASFPDSQIERVHAQLGVTRAEFGEMMAALEATLVEFDMEPVDIEHVRREVGRRERLVVAET